MANPLTGDYEAVVQIAIRQINGLLGTLHQNGVDPRRGAEAASQRDPAHRRSSAQTSRGRRCSGIG